MTIERRYIGGREVDGSYRSSARRRRHAEVRRDANRRAKLCINENKAGTHGKATHGVRCAACDGAHKGRPS